MYTGLFDFRPASFFGLFREHMGKPVLNLDYLLDSGGIVQHLQPLDWDTFESKQRDNSQVLKVRLYTFYSLYILCVLYVICMCYI